ncbi:MFS transporter [Streptomyces sp. CYG20]|nr:MFS transporter [Streptomyces sp. COG21]MBT3084328.1 MFS transporter [Streptomyces sp. COG20]MBT3090922.1 MFS transporter [Streptomyces sp. CYG21]MBT3099732.1 MFS transporter [Streptomyces sp. CBG30]MBT3102312.1 MFS transporter [Streptomyces sp. COG19]MBT3109357.1 MFS transporter [Streptomyces sp. CYG20]
MMGLMPHDETPAPTQAPPQPQTLNRSSAGSAAARLPAPRLPGAVDAAPAPWLLRLIAVGLVLAALNLRPAITSLGALLEEVREGLHMSGSVAGLLTSVPPLCFAVFGVMAPRLARRFGAGTVVCAGMAAIAAGLAIRPYIGSTAGFLAASALALMGIAVSNILMPVIVKRWFPDRVGTMTGLYSMALALGTALAAAVTVPLTGALGGNWQSGLAVWAVLAAVAVLPWIVLVRDRTPAPGQREATRPGRGSGTASASGAGSGAASGSASASGSGSADRSGPASASASGSVPSSASASADARSAEAPALRITRSRTAWGLACFFGLQATAAYITMGWMPQIFRDAGVPAGTAGVLLAVTMAMGVPLAFVIPRVAGRLRQQGPIVVVLGLCGLIGYTGLYLAPAAGAWAWALLLGVANCAFPLALTMIGMRSRTGAGVVRLSAFAQSTGYLLSIPGPLLVGVLYQHSGGWGLPIALMAGLMIPQMVAGVLAGRDRTIEDEC